jgi:hypothetical protein
VGDAGEDHSTRFCVEANDTIYAQCVEHYAFPIQSMDVSSYSFDCRQAIARVARIRGDAAGAKYWEEQAAAVADNLKSLWDARRGAMYDRDANDTVVSTLVHDNLRVMWAGAVDQVSGLQVQ